MSIREYKHGANFWKTTEAERADWKPRTDWERALVDDFENAINQLDAQAEIGEALHSCQVIIRDTEAERDRYRETLEKCRLILEWAKNECRCADGLSTCMCSCRTCQDNRRIDMGIVEVSAALSQKGTP